MRVIVGALCTTQYWITMRGDKRPSAEHATWWIKCQGRYMYVQDHKSDASVTTIMSDAIPNFALYVMFPCLYEQLTYLWVLESYNRLSFKKIFLLIVKMVSVAFIYATQHLITMRRNKPNRLVITWSGYSTSLRNNLFMHGDYTICLEPFSQYLFFSLSGLQYEPMKIIFY